MAFSSAEDAAFDFHSFLTDLLKKRRDIDVAIDNDAKTIFDVLSTCSESLRKADKTAEAEAVDQVREKVVTEKSFGGLGLKESHVPDSEQYDEIKFLCEAWLEAVKSKENARSYLAFNESRPSGTKPMTLAQKIFTQHALGSKEAKDGLAVGDVVRVGVDWIIASELSWYSMADMYEELNNPGIWRNDRFWIAGDHFVHPAIREDKKVKAFVETAEKAKRDFRMTEFQGMNYTIMHTEFVRERAEPGMLVFGSDSHTSSGGAVGCLAVGLGSADVMMCLSVGETWFKIPESIFIELKGEPGFGINGKDVILHILKQLKRNTVAAERIVEFGGEGARHLSLDARFTICNMCTEFGAITGVWRLRGILMAPNVC